MFVELPCSCMGWEYYGICDCGYNDTLLREDEIIKKEWGIDDDG